MEFVRMEELIDGWILHISRRNQNTNNWVFCFAIYVSLGAQKRGYYSVTQADLQAWRLAIPSQLLVKNL